jgi:hypothetical protein
LPDEKTNALLITGLLAIMGTVAGGVVKGYWDTKLAAEDFHSKLILRAMEPADADVRIKGLQFLVDTNLISDPAVREGIGAVIQKGPASIPQFLPANAVPPPGGVAAVPSVKATMAALNPALRGKILALTGLKVRHGDVIDGLTPIFAEISPDLKVGSRSEAPSIGGTGGGETLLEQPGYLVTGIDAYRGDYFGRVEVVQLQVTWERLTPQGLDPKDRIVSPKLGSGSFAKISQPAKQFRADPGHYISDFSASSSSHSSGETFFNDISIKQERLPLAQ